MLEIKRKKENPLGKAQRRPTTTKAFELCLNLQAIKVKI